MAEFFDGLNRDFDFLRPDMKTVEDAVTIQHELSATCETTEPQRQRTVIRCVASALLAASLLALFVSVAWLKSPVAEEIPDWHLTATSFTPRKIEPLYLKEISALAISPDKKWIAYGDGGGHLRVIDYQLKDERTLPGYSAGISSLAWSSDSNQIAAGTVDGSIFVFDRKRGTQFDVFQSKIPYAIGRLVFCNTNQTIAALSMGRLVLCNLKNGSTIVRPLYSSHARELVVDATGNHVIAYGLDGVDGVDKGFPRSHILSFSNETYSLKSLKVPTDRYLMSFAWSKDSSKFFAISEAGDLITWRFSHGRSKNVNKKQILQPLSKGLWTVLSTVGSSKLHIVVGSQLYQVDSSGTVGHSPFVVESPKLQNALLVPAAPGEYCLAKNSLAIVDSTGAVLRQRQGDHCAAGKRVFNAGPDEFVVLDSTGKVRWLQGDTVRAVTKTGESVQSIAQSERNPRQFALSTESGSRVIHLGSESFKTTAKSTMRSEQIVWHKQKDILAGFENDNLKLNIWNIGSGDQQQISLPCGMNSIEWHPHQEELLMGPVDYRRDLNQRGVRWVHNGVYHWSRRAVGEIRYVEPAVGELRDEVAISYSHDGRKAITGSQYAQVVMYDWTKEEAGIEIAGRNRVCQQHVLRATSFLWHPEDKNIVYSAGTDSTICCWNANTNSLQSRHQFHRGAIRKLALSNSKQHVCSVDSSGNLYLWDVDEPADQKHCRIPWPINDITWDQTDDYLVVCHSAGIAKMDAQSLTIVESLLFYENGGEQVYVPSDKNLVDEQIDSPFGIRTYGLLLATDSH